VGSRPRFGARFGLLVWMAAGAGLAGCGDDSLRPEDQLVRQGESKHFVYYAAAGESVDTAYQERHYAWAMEKLDLTYTQKIAYYKYRDRDHLRRATGEETNGFAEPSRNRFHTIWPMDNHEYVHVVFVSLVGSPPSLFSEGVAVAHHGASISGDFDGPPLWNGTSAHYLARGFLNSGQLPDLKDLAVTNRFWDHDQNLTYAVGGSFVRFLIDDAGIASFKDFSARVNRDDSFSGIDADFTAVYGESLSVWWDRWKAFLTSAGAG